MTQKNPPFIKFHRAVPSVIQPMRGDKSALGALPTAAFQYCEAVRTASSFGWYIFPGSDIELKWDGAETLHKNNDGVWTPLSSLYFGDDYAELWDKNAPSDMKGWRLPHVSTIFVPGIIQIWSGFFVSTSTNWSVLVRPVANVTSSNSFACFEGVVETDQFQPCPLFVNIKLISTDRPIVISQYKPLFMVQMVHRDAYSGAVDIQGDLASRVDDSNHSMGLSMEDWNGMRRTTRSVQGLRGFDSEHQFGGYGAEVRRRTKSE
jgi:hypothetical protein